MNTIYESLTPILYKPKEVAVLLNISISMVYKLIEIGDLNAVRIGRAVRIRFTEIDKYLNGAR